jgi:hypothetical protein
VVLLAVPKSGTEYLAHLLGLTEFLEWEADFSKYDVKDNVYGHIPYTEAIENKLLGIPKIFLRRDPRDCIVSWFHWAGCSIEEALHKCKFRMFAMLPWEDVADHVIRYEDLISAPEHSLSAFNIVGDINFKANTFRKGRIGDWIYHFNSKQHAQYERDYKPVRHSANKMVSYLQKKSSSA